MIDANEDWRHVGFGGAAWFGASSHVHAASLAARIAELTPTGGALPDLDVRGDGVRVRVGASAPTALTDAISEAAHALGLVPDPGVLLELRLRVDTAEPAAVLPFWRAALAYRDVGADVATADTAADAIADPWRRRPVVRFERSDDARPLRNRIHVDSGHPGPTAATLDALDGAGGHVRFASEWYSTVADHDGNEIDVVPGGALGDDESTADWSVLFGAMACYPGVPPRQAADLAVAAARAADDAGIPLMIDLRPGGVVLDSGKDQWEHVEGFIDLARAAQAAARAVGLTAGDVDNSSLRFVQAGIDAVDVTGVREFWRAALDYVPAPMAGITDLYDPRQLNPVVFIQPMDADEIDRRRQRNRTTVELLVPADHVQRRIDAALAAGGRLLDDAPSVPHARRLADPEGNELTVRATRPG